MGYRTSSTRRSTAASAVSSQAVIVNTGNASPVGSSPSFSAVGSTIAANTSISLGVTAVGQTSAATITTVSAGPAISTIQYLDSNNAVIVGDIAVSTLGGNILINGTGFVANSSIYVNNALVSNTFISSTQIRAILPAASAGNVSLMIFTPTNTGTISSNGIRYSGSPTWTTAAVSFQNATAANVALVASSDSTLTYTLQAGSTLPTGISLISTGYLSGTATGYSTNTTTSAVIIATDSEGQATQQTVNITVTVSDPQFNYTTLLLNGETSVTPFIADASTNNFGLTIAGDSKATKFSPYYGDGYYSNLFNGSTDKLSVPASSTLAFGAGDFTIEAWFYLTGTQTQTYGHAIAGTYDGATNGGWGIVVNRSTDTRALAFVHANAWQLSYYPSSYLNINQWYHVAVVRSGTTMTMYLNGASVASATYSTTDAVSATCYVGSQGASSCYFPGYLSNVRMVKGTAVYTGAFTPSTTPLTAVANTQLLTCQSNRFVDKSTNAAVVTATGTTVSTAIPFAASSSYATYGSAYFDGTGDWLLNSVTSSNLVLTGDFTVEAWINPANVSGTKGIMGIFGTGGGWYLGLNGATIRFSTGLAGGDFDSGTVAANVWSHIAVTRSGNSLRVFLNGTQVNTTTDVSAQNFTISNPLYIGQINTAGWTYTGYIADARVIKGSALYTANFTPPTVPLTAVANTQLLTCQYNGGANNYGIVDHGIGTSAITRTGVPTQGSFSPYSQTGWSNYFNGSTDYFTTPSNAALSFGTGDFTVECWLYVMGAGDNQFQFPVQTRDGTNVGFYLQYNRTNTNITFATDSGTPLTVSSANGSISDFTWYHVAATRSGTSVKLFLNGTQVATQTSADNITSSGPMYVSRRWVTDGALHYFNGYISNLRIVKGTAIYTASFTPPTSPLTAVAGTSVLTCQSNRFIDNSTNNFAVTVAGTPSVQAVSPFPPGIAYSPSLHGGSMYVSNATANYLTVTDSNIWNTGTTTPSFTVEAWIYPIGITGGCVVSGMYANSKVPFVIGIGNAVGVTATNNQIWFGYYSAGWTGVISTSQLTMNQWTHVAGVYDGTNRSLYVNGVRVATTAATWPAFSAVTTAGYIGKRWDGVGGGADGFNGYISDVRITKGSAVYSGATLTVPTAPLAQTTSTSLLLNMKNGGIVDAHASNVLETVGGAQLSTAAKKYGSASMSFSGSAQYAIATSSVANPNFAFGTGDFTIEFWMYLNSVTGGAIIFDSRPATTNGFYPTIYIPSAANTTIAFLTNSADRINSSVNTIATSTWYHVALCRYSGNTKLFVNGTQVGSTYADTNAYLSGINRPVIAASGYDLTGNMNGYVDDLRITKGFARYTANFTAPTSGHLGQ